VVFHAAGIVVVVLCDDSSRREKKSVEPITTTLTRELPYKSRLNLSLSQCNLLLEMESLRGLKRLFCGQFVDQSSKKFVLAIESYRSW
jgi:hypothetical protein